MTLVGYKYLVMLNSQPTGLDAWVGRLLDDYAINKYRIHWIRDLHTNFYIQYIGACEWTCLVSSKLVV